MYNMWVAGWLLQLIFYFIYLEITLSSIPPNMDIQYIHKKVLT